MCDTHQTVSACVALNAPPLIHASASQEPAEPTATPGPAPPPVAAKKRKATEPTAEAAEPAPEPPAKKKAAAKKKSEAPISDFRRAAYGEHQTHTQFCMRFFEKP